MKQIEEKNKCYKCKIELDKKIIVVFFNNKILHEYCSIECFSKDFKREKKKKVFLINNLKNKVKWVSKKYPRKEYEIKFNI